jgi:hypothetical protein
MQVNFTAKFKVKFTNNKFNNVFERSVQIHNFIKSISWKDNYWTRILEIFDKSFKSF